MAAMNEVFDVVVAGGAAIGSSLAYHLAADPGFKGRILVLEPDPGYERAASARSAASIRQQFSAPVNVKLSLYGIDFLRDLGTRLAVDGEKPEIGLREGGYLFMATPSGEAVLRENHALQISLGADIAFYDRTALAAQFPWLATDDLVAGTWGRTGEGWFDGYGLVQALRRKARTLGVEYRKAALTGIDMQGERAAALRLSDGTTISAGHVVLAAGTGTRELVRAIGFDIPVHAKKRFVFTFECRTRIDGVPLTIDPGGVYFRPEGEGFIAGTVPAEDKDPDVAPDDFEVDYDFFDEYVWPALAARVPAFEAIKRGRAWAGHYDMNLFDANALIGFVPGTSNVLLANGFSGHGLQQSPGVGRGLAELIRHGRFTTLDLSDLSPARLLTGAKMLEKNVV
ncbi:MAG: FAD-binding oxidoreductase [Alphaproteobacteria bacterium]|nr:FAD-binding oxidoreductase [Alphaproteobacteria bacterium]